MPVFRFCKPLVAEVYLSSRKRFERALRAPGFVFASTSWKALVRTGATRALWSRTRFGWPRRFLEPTDPGEVAADSTFIVSDDAALGKLVQSVVVPNAVSKPDTVVHVMIKIMSVRDAISAD